MHDRADKVFELGKLLADHKGKDVIAIDMRDVCFWTDFFLVATVSSGTHLAGLKRRIKEWAALSGFKTRENGKTSKDDTWNLIDMGDIIVHLMVESAREFYELENLWSDGKITRF
ncbi:MAG: ribosome silencing factor [Spirochaetaceae bacterium]|jgi:ribosome-associated protein|nr:ribosome silencing factor [Spirochaetaceae bacterium]